MLKMLVIGDVNAGKTSLVQRFINNTFNPKYEATIGAEFLTKNITISDQAINVQIWDTSGDAKEFSQIQNYATGAHVWLIVLDPTKPKPHERLAHWLSVISEYKNSIRIAVVTKWENELDKTQFDSKSLESFCADNGLIKPIYASAKTGEHVAEVFGQSVKEVLKSNANAKKIAEQQTSEDEKTERYKAVINTYLTKQLQRIPSDTEKHQSLTRIQNKLANAYSLPVVKDCIAEIKSVTRIHQDKGKIWSVINFCIFWRKPTSYKRIDENFDENNDLRRPSRRC